MSVVMKLICTILMCAAACCAKGQSLILNEVMASNSSTISDKDGDYSDWVELYNSGSVTIDLEEYWLTDNKDEPKKWHLPSIKLAPSGHLLVFCSGKDLKLGELHTNFKISAAGEKVRLLDVSGVQVDEIESVDIGTDRSFGSATDGALKRIIFDRPTPGMPNGGLPILANEVQFSSMGGIYENGFMLTLKGDDTSEIYFTIDGNIPTTESVKYVSPTYLSETLFSTKNISSYVMSPSDVYHLPTGILPQAIVIRAAKFYNGKRISATSTQTYLIREFTSQFSDIPIVSIATDSGSLFSLDTGIFVPGVHFDASAPDITGNYFESGSDWERVINVEYYTPNNTATFNQQCGVRMHGSGSRKPPQKAVRLYARSEYGNTSFSAQVFGEKSFSTYKRLVLKPFYSSWSQNGCTDYVAGRLAKSLNLDYLAAEPILLFVNGEYWGIYYVQERLDERYLEQNTAAQGDSIDIIESWYAKVSEGNSKNFTALYDFIKNNDLAAYSNYVRVENWMDIDNFIDYQIFQAFIANYDWPANNMKCWRERKEGAKWRWVFFDADGALENLGFDGLSHATDTLGTGWPSSPQSTLLLRKLLENETFEEKYKSRLRQLLNDELHRSVSQALVGQLRSLLEYEIDNQVRRFGKPVSTSAWDTSVLNLDFFMKNRACMVAQHAENMFGERFFVDGCNSSTALFEELKIVPNPAYNSCKAVFTSSASELAEVEISNTEGQVVVAYAELIHKRINTLDLELLGLNAGVYVVRIQSDNQLFVGKVVVR